ncbi:acylneuraminate cytidylyltransferase family protein [Salinarimonas sp. NSM]|uniref:acylneuraminate cytidylyltransferase family protein n=1 Tax=Salinarimonas sp. NSM TaxID=3458003 RepID=UPI004036AF7C
MKVDALGPCLGLVTARGGSKGVRDKATRPLCGKPVVAYTIETALACDEITDVLVSTDSSTIKDVAVEAGAQVPFLRPDSLATDLSKQEDAVLHAMDWCERQGRRYDWLCLLEPTAPLRTVATLRRGFDLLRRRPELPGVFSISPVSVPPSKCASVDVHGTVAHFYSPEKSVLNRQELPQYYKLSNLCVVIRWDEFKRAGNFLADGRAAALVVDPIEAIDIDEPLDFLVAEMLLARGLGSEGDTRAIVNGTRDGG